MLPKKRVRPAADIIGISKEEADSMDDTLSSISELAYSSPKEQLPPQLNTRSARSRFFFVPTESIDIAIKKRKKQFEKPKLHHVDDQIQRRLKKYKTEVPKKLKGNIDSVREFFLTEIAPRTVAMDAAIAQARGVVGGLLHTEVDATVFARFERMVNSAVDMKMASFVAKHFKLTHEDATKLLADLNFRPQHMSLFGGAPPPPAQPAAPRKRGRSHSTTPVMTRPMKRRKKHEEEFEDLE